MRTAIAILLFGLVAPGGARAAAGRDAARTAVLDRVVAVAGDHAILASDVDDEMRFTAMEQGGAAADNGPAKALERVIDRTLIDEQRALQPGLGEVPRKDLERAVEALRASIPDCGDCKTVAGWKAFLAAHGFTPAEVANRVWERLAILRFIDLRFSVAARVPNADVQKYYEHVLRPELEKKKAAVPALSTVAGRIREILRQQQVSAMVDEWIKSLRSEAKVRIVDPAYGAGASGE